MIRASRFRVCPLRATAQVTIRLMLKVSIQFATGVKVWDERYASVVPPPPRDQNRPT